MSESLSVYIQRQLKRKGVTSKEAATAIGVTPTYFARVKRGKAKPSLEFCRNLAEFFGDSLLNIMRLAGWLPDEEFEDLLIEKVRILAAQDPGFEEFLRMYTSLESKESREIFLSMLRAAVEAVEGKKI